MCGIVGYIGKNQAYNVLINGLKRLEYRGYDSAGIALLSDKHLIYKCKGKVSKLEDLIQDKTTEGTCGIAHTRWATHGEPNEVNAHPHESMNGLFVLVHNGIIENYAVLRKYLTDRGYIFRSETDTEVIVNLIEFYYLKGDLSVESAVQLALQKLVGAYGLVISCKDAPNQLIAVRKSSPLVIGIGTDEYYIASDAAPIVEYTKSVIFLDNDLMAIIRNDEMRLISVTNTKLQPKIEEIDLDIDAIEKGGFEHFMLKEIFEQPKSIRDTFRGRVGINNSDMRLGGLADVMPKLVAAERITIIGCGTSWHAALLGEYMIEELARIPVEVEYASEFRYRNPIINQKDVIIAVSQSGETADTLAAIRLAKASGATVIGICNVVGSSLSRETDAGVFTHAGPEIGVASTKAFTAQVTVLAMLANILAFHRCTISETEFVEFIQQLSQIPDKIEQVLAKDAHIKQIAEKLKDRQNALYLGRGYFFPVALEGALKLKEISYIHAEGYPAAEMKHGPIALIDENMPVVIIATKDHSYDKVASNVQEVKARRGIIIAIVNEGDEFISEMADYTIEIPESGYFLSALTAIIPLQLLSYHIAVLRGCNVDQPRNLAKSVTVE